MPEDVSWEIERGRCDGRPDGNVGGPFDIAIFPAQCFSGGAKAALSCYNHDKHSHQTPVSAHQRTRRLPTDNLI